MPKKIRSLQHNIEAHRAKYARPLNVAAKTQIIDTDEVKRIFQEVGRIDPQNSGMFEVDWTETSVAKI
jgi:hypothetical protein